jgi:hypothetical protein
MRIDSDGRPRADMNNDCVLDGRDVDMFVQQLLNL